MTSPIMLPRLDERPTRFVDSHEILANMTDEEVLAGLGLATRIDPHDHEDSGERFLNYGSIGRMRLTLTAVTASDRDGAALMRDALMDHGAHRIKSPYTGRTGGVSIELQPGAGSGGGTKRARLHHHTAGPKITASRLTPSLFVCKNGRTDLSPPLCNGYGGGDFWYRIMTGPDKWANHPGLGGPMRTSSGTIPEDNGRPYLWGTEWDHDGVSEWLDEELEWMAVCDAGLCDFFGQKIEDQGEHKDPWAPGRKPDRNIITVSGSIARTRKVFNLYRTDVEDDDMGYSQWPLKERRALIDDVARAVFRGEFPNVDTGARERVEWIADAGLVKATERLNLIVTGDSTDPSVPDTHPFNLADAVQGADAAAASVESLRAEVRELKEMIRRLLPPETPTT